MGNLLYTAGHGPVREDGVTYTQVLWPAQSLKLTSCFIELKHFMAVSQGRVGSDMSVEEAVQVNSIPYGS